MSTNWFQPHGIYRIIPYVLLVSISVIPLRSIAEEPRIEVVGDAKNLILPAKFVEYLNSNYANYRIPKKTDLKYVWESLNKNKGSLPYVTWGDYDGNGLTDIAIFLLSDTNSNWEFGIFLQNANGYSFEYGKDQNSARYKPDAVSMKTLNKGSAYTFTVLDEETGKATKYSNKYPVDAVMYQPHMEGDMEIFYWDSGVFRKRVYGE